MVPFIQRIENKFQRTVAQAFRKIEQHGLVEKASLPYTTHIPFLVALAQVLDIRQVLELGSGLHSTPLFLNQAIFPHVERLVSYENEQEWLVKVRQAVGHDERLDLRFVQQPIYEAIQELDLAPFDLILVDDSRKKPLRAATIRAIAREYKRQTGVVVIHDYERLDYRFAARRFPHRFRFTALNPNTGVVWNKAPIQQHDLIQLNQTIADQSLDPGDVTGWAQVLQHP